MTRYQRIAALYDIHANLPALEAVLEELKSASVDLIVVGGDVLPGPMPAESLTCLFAIDMPVLFIQGNGDREVLAQSGGIETEWYRSAPERWREPIRWSAHQLSQPLQMKMAGWPKTCTVPVEGIGAVLFCHATPRSDIEVFTRTTPTELLLPIFESLNVDLVVCGHTHMQFDRRIGSVRVLNAGSVGMPYGGPEACWLMLGPQVNLRQTPYDLSLAAQRIMASGYPQAETFVKQHVLDRPSEQTMLMAFNQVAMRSEGNH